MTSDFEKRYEEKYGKAPEYQAVLGYAAVEVLADGIKRAGTSGGDKLLDALRKTDLKTAVGRITFDERGQYNQPLPVGQLVDGKVIRLAPADQADGKLAPWVPIPAR
jgi:branched-chain amino acid transport system substrate-binding protein